MKRVINSFKIVCCMIILSVLMCLNTYAASGLEYVVDSDTITLFVAQEENATTQDVLCSISGESIAVEKSGSVLTDNFPTDILVLIDASTSVTDKDSKQIVQLINEMLAVKQENTAITIATFGETYTEICARTTDRWTIAKSVEELTHKEEGTRLYQILSAAMDNVLNMQGISYRQIIVITDGVEYDPSGITKDEIYLQLKNRSIPIHTVGLLHQNNTETLKELYALSRITNGVSITLDGQNSLSEAASALFADTTQYITLQLPGVYCDGSVKTIGLFFGAAQDAPSLTIDVRTPLLQVQSSNEGLPEESTQETNAAVEVPPIQSKKTDNNFFIYGAAAILAIALIAVLVLVQIKKKKVKPQVPKMNKEPLIEPIKKVENETPHISRNLHNNNETALAGEPSGSTQLLIDSQPDDAQKLVLIDTFNTFKRFEINTQWQTYIGRDKNRCTVVIEDDNSVSGVHCMIYSQNGAVYISDQGSKNKTILNDQPIQSDAELKSGDQIKIGRQCYTVSI